MPERAALIGNPSDGYFGKTIAFVFKNFRAKVHFTFVWMHAILRFAIVSTFRCDWGWRVRRQCVKILRILCVKTYGFECVETFGFKCDFWWV
jgi:hypothetical protein